MPETKIDFSHLPPEALRIKRVNGRAPDNTNIKFLGISAEAARVLTPAAAKLTKAELVALDQNLEREQRTLGLTVQDINSVKRAFTMPMQIDESFSVEPMLEVSVSCCCCTPCCCAAAMPVLSAVS
jgi:hypothetical protein